MGQKGKTCLSIDTRKRQCYDRLVKGINRGAKGARLRLLFRTVFSGSAASSSPDAAGEGAGILIEPGLHLMDCMEGMRQFPDGFFDLAIVDPPYGGGNSEIGLVGHCSGGTVRPIQKCERTGGTWAEKYGKKIHGVGRCTRKRLLRRAFPRFTQSNYLGRKLFCAAADQVLPGVG